MKYLDDYFSEFTDQITRYQWPDPFKSIDGAKEVLQDFLDEMTRDEMLLFAVVDTDERFIGSVLQRKCFTEDLLYMASHLLLQ